MHDCSVFGDRASRCDQNGVRRGARLLASGIRGLFTSEPWIPSTSAITRCSSGLACAASAVKHRWPTGQCCPLQLQSIWKVTIRPVGPARQILFR